jgi:phospholipid/cholesterol/gamma-HCH transport system permease protein
MGKDQAAQATVCRRVETAECLASSGVTWLRVTPDEARHSANQELKPGAPMTFLRFLESLGHFSHFAFRSLVVLPFSLRRPREFLNQLYRIFLGALPLALAGGGAVGAVIWMHGREPLQKVGGPQAVSILPQALSLVVVLELAPIVAGLIVAGRSGASLGAELGSMRLTEQVDALMMLGLSPLRELVGPRVLACMVSLPLLTAFIIFAALGSGLLAEQLGGSLTLTQFQTEVLRPLRLHNVIPALAKTVVFGYLVGVTGCFAGLEAEGGTEGVGRAATRGVVLSIFLVLMADLLLVALTESVL